MSPQNWLCRSERNPALDTHGDNAYSPQIPDTKLTVTSKVQFLQLQHVFRQKYKKHNPSHVQRHTLPSVGFKGFYEGQWLRARLCCRKISESIFWLYYLTPR